MQNKKQAIEKILQKAGIEINGPHAWDIRVHDERLYGRILAQGSLGLGESYMDGWWDSPRIDLCIERLLRSGRYANALSIPLILLALKSRLLNLQSKIGAKKVIATHYDLDVALYKTFLDPYMQYSCGYFHNTHDLAEAQKNKMELVCKKLHLKKTDRLLDIGCGWGGFAKYAAETYGCTVVGVTLSEEQASFARTFTAGLPVEIRTQDYRDIPANETFDKIVSIGMFEHVGYKNYRRAMEKMSSLLKDDGIVLVQTIAQNITSWFGNPWVEKYIFPGGMLPSVRQIGASIEGLFIMEDWHNFGPHYHETLLAWDKNFQEHWGEIQHRYPPTFYRMFRYFFNSFAGAFKARRIQLWQIVLSKGSSDRAYERVR